MLRLFADASGHECNVPLKGALFREGNQYALIDALSSQVKNRPMNYGELLAEDEDEDDTNFEDDTNDDDYFSYL